MAKRRHANITSAVNGNLKDTKESVAKNDLDPQSQAKKRNTNVALVALAAIAIAVLPRMLMTSGVAEMNYATEFIQQSVMPNIERALSVINGSLSFGESFNHVDQTIRPGYRLAQLGAKACHPIMVVPGFVTSGLEWWRSEPCASKFFRQRVWGGLNMANSFIADRGTLCFNRVDLILYYASDVRTNF